MGAGSYTHFSVGTRENFVNWGSLLKNDSSLSQVDINLVSTAWLFLRMLRIHTWVLRFSQQMLIN